MIRFSSQPALIYGKGGSISSSYATHKCERFALVFNATLFVNHIDFCLALRIIWLVFLQNQFCLYFSFRNNKFVYGEFIFS